MINFKEIPRANSGDGDQDTFELFARDFFEILGYEIVDNPGRGSDGGRDLIIKEIRKGISNVTNEAFWLVSCKHFAITGKSVTPTTENNINDRIIANGCDGFVGFYSTLPSEGLLKILNKIPTQIFDNKKIETHIIGNEKLRDVFLRYFPKSYKKWELLQLPYNPIKLFEFYLNEKYEKEVNLLESIFLKSDNLLIALINSENFEEFLEFKEIKLFEVDNLWSEFNKVYEKNRSEYSKSFYNLTWKIVQDYLISFLKKKKLTEEKLISCSWSYNSMYLLSTNTLILNTSKLSELEVLYADLKAMLR